MADGQSVWQADVGEHVIALAWSPSGQQLAAAAVGGPVTVFEAATGRVQYQLAGHDPGTTTMAWHHLGTILASDGQDQQVRFWQGCSGRLLIAVDAGVAWVEKVAWHPDGRSLASAAGRQLRLWDDQGHLVQVFPEHTSTIADIGWRPGTDELAAATYGGVTLWSPGRAEAVRELPWKGSLLALAWSPDGRALACGTQDAALHYWDFSRGQELQMQGYRTKVRHLAWDATSRFLANGGNKDIAVWDTAGTGPAGTKPRRLIGHDGFVSALAYQPNGPLLASGGEDGTMLLWGPAGDGGPHLRATFPTQVTQLAWSANGRWLAAATDCGSIRVYHAETESGR